MADLDALRENENHLADALLPDDPDLTQALSQRDLFVTHAYLVLACAIIEEFIEACFEEHVRFASASDPAGYAGCFLALATRFAGELIGQQISTATEAAPVLRGLYSSKVVAANNGIKPRNLAVLAKPVGLLSRLEQECDDLLAPADALGAKRGAVAHLGKVEEEIRPAEARELVKNVVDQLHLLKALLQV